MSKTLNEELVELNRAVKELGRTVWTAWEPVLRRLAGLVRRAYTRGSP